MSFSNESIIHKKCGSLEYLQFRHFNDTGLVKHCFTTRRGGVSKGDFDSLNLKFETEDIKDNIIKNRKIICDEIGIDYNNLICCSQIHGDNVEIVNGKEIDLYQADGLLTGLKEVPLTTFYADCVPLFFLDPVKKIIANSHAGWRGTVMKIGQTTALRMIKEFGSRPEDILVGIGPSIGKCCFEIDFSVYSQFNNIFKDNNKICIKNEKGLFINLWEANRIQLEDVGIKTENICISGICTMCNKEHFFSHRGNNQKTGRMAAIIQLV